MLTLLDDSSNPIGTAYDVVKETTERESHESLIDVYEDATDAIMDSGVPEDSDLIIASEYNAIVDSVIDNGITVQNMRALHNMTVMGDAMDEQLYVRAGYTQQAMSPAMIIGIIGSLAALGALFKYFIWNKHFGTSGSSSASAHVEAIAEIEKTTEEIAEAANTATDEQKHEVAKILAADDLVEAVSQAAEKETKADGDAKKTGNAFLAGVKTLITQIKKATTKTKAIDVHILEHPDSFGAVNALLKSNLESMRHMVGVVAALDQMTGDLASVTKGFGESQAEKTLLDNFAKSFNALLKENKDVIAAMISPDMLWNDVKVISGAPMTHKVRTIDELISSQIKPATAMVDSTTDAKEAIELMMQAANADAKINITSKSVSGKKIPPLDQLDLYKKNVDEFASLSEKLAAKVKVVDDKMKGVQKAGQGIDVNEGNRENAARYKAATNDARQFTVAITNVQAVISKANALILLAAASHMHLRVLAESTAGIDMARKAAK